jgi:cytoskeleton protein RodZ
MSPTDLDTSTEQTPREEPARETPGGQLLAARRRQGLSLGDVARQLKLSVRQVEALERDDHASFAGPVFVRGFLRNYAKLLGLDADALLTTAAPPPAQGAPVTAAAASEQPPMVTEEAPGAERGGRMLTAVVIIALVGVALVLLASNLARDSGKPAEVAAVQTPVPAPVAAPAVTPEPAASAPIAAVPVPAEAATPASVPQEAAQPAAPPVSSTAAGEPASAPAPQEPPPAVAANDEQPGARPQVSTSGKGSARVQMEFEGESWVEVRDGTGATIFARLNAAGTKRVVRGDPPLSLVVGNAANVKVTWHDKPVELQPHPKSDVARITLE